MELVEGGGGGWPVSWCLRETGEADKVCRPVGEGTRGGATLTSAKLSEVPMVGEPGSELLFINNPLLTDFGDVLGDLSKFRPPLLLEATDSNLETRAWFRSSGEGEGEPWTEFLGEWWGEFLADPLSDPPCECGAESQGEWYGEFLTELL